MSQLPLALGWIAYALLHSLLASLAIKAAVARRWPAFAPGYRLAYNAFAGLSALPLLWLMVTIPGDPLWAWAGPWAWLGNGLALAAIAVLVLSPTGYDMAEFLGLRQWRAGHVATAERGDFTLSDIHRFVRHPWYCVGLVVVWTRDMNEAMLVSALAISMYFVVGSRLEERKLVLAIGDRYRRYCTQVPGLLPLPWKYLTRAEAAQLLKEGKE